MTASLIRDSFYKVTEKALSTPIKEHIVPRKFDLEDMELLYQELTNAPTYNWGGYIEHKPQILGMLGLRSIGSGAFSTCYEIIGVEDKVIKIGMRTEDAYNAYVGYCRQHQGEEGIPNIYFVKQLPNGMLVTILDRLYNDTLRITKETVNPFILDRLDYHGLSTWRFSESPKRFRREYAGDFKELQRTVDNIIVFFKDIARIDLHEGNYMFTKEGKVVITDPVSYTAEYLQKEGHNVQ